MKLRLDQLLVLVVLCLILLVPIRALDRGPLYQTLASIALAPVPITETTALDKQSFVATLSARSIMVVDLPSGAVLLAKNGQEQVPPASTTKMITALVAQRIYEPQEVVTIGEAAFSIGNNMGLVVGEQITVDNLLAGLLISSGNDAAVALASHHPAGYNGFVADMNVLANQLHLSFTSFRNPSGLDDAEHVTTARDLALAARELLLNPRLKEIVSTKQTTITDITGEYKHLLVNTNLLLHTEPGVIGVKTGTTELAKENVVTVVERGERQLLFVVLGSEDRYADTKQLINWVEREYKWETVNPPDWN